VRITKKKIVKEIISYTMIFIVSFIVALVITHNFRLARVCGTSMEPTLQDGDIILVKCDTKPDDQDIITLTSDGNDNFTHKDLVKRYYAERSTDNEIWVEGDNKAESLDSRLAGTLDRNNIDGVVILDLSKFFRDLF
jgi:signal peptidase I